MTSYATNWWNLQGAQSVPVFSDGTLSVDELRRQAKAAGFSLVPNRASSVKSHDAPSIKVGDVIECRQIRPFADDLYRPMIVRSVEPHKFSAELMSGDFGEPGQAMMAFEMSAKGRTWR